MYAERSLVLFFMFSHLKRIFYYLKFWNDILNLFIYRYYALFCTTYIIIWSL